jgi:hypothetical protein
VPTRIVGTAFRLLQHNEKNSFPINETCMEAVPAQRSIVRRREAGDATERRARHDADFAARFSRASETPANWAFLPCRKIRAQPAMHRLTSSAATPRGCLATPPSAIFATKKILRKSRRRAAPTCIGCARRSAERPNRSRAIRKTGCSDRSGKPLDEAFARTSRRRFASLETLGTRRRRIGAKPAERRKPARAIRDRASS